MELGSVSGLINDDFHQPDSRRTEPELPGFDYILEFYMEIFLLEKI